MFFCCAANDADDATIDKDISTKVVDDEKLTQPENTSPADAEASSVDAAGKEIGVTGAPRPDNADMNVVESTIIDVELAPGKIGVRMHQDTQSVYAILEEGTLPDYNRSVDEKANIAVGDILWQVNTTSGAVTDRRILIKTVQSECQAGRPLKLKFKKP
eukprot:TRINITY_DN758_c0_g1_i4.p1 TRINITY_DN758_c0_g1~~TRINITY_DN758_c0_g1_i4.p1  ORF type:complete len:159 (-),score=35.05 TRINITY_DN758_c0_g1_i4:118-594(-)